MNWSEHLDDMSDELERIERQVSTDEVHVSTRGDRTEVTLVYDHSCADR